MLGTFTATSTTQSFSVGIGYTTSQFIPVNTIKSQLNALVVQLNWLSALLPLERAASRRASSAGSYAGRHDINCE